MPNNFQISELSAFSGSDARRFCGGGESDDEGDRGRFLGGTPPDRGGTPLLPDTEPDLAACDLGTGLLDCEDLTASLGIVDEDVLVLNVGLDCEDDLVPDGVDAVLPLAAAAVGCDLASGRDAASMRYHDSHGPEETHVDVK